MQRVLGYGDRTRWTEQFRVTATAPIERYMQTIAATFDERRGWTTVSADERQLLLRKESEQGGSPPSRVSSRKHSI